MELWEIIVLSVSIGVFLIGIFAAFIRFRGKSIYYQERIKKLKSEIRIVKAKYVQAIKQINTKQGKTVDNTTKLKDVLKPNYNIGFGGTAGGYSLDGNELHKTDIRLIDQLSSSLLSTQNSLNEAINEYNVYINKFFYVPFAKMLKLKKQDYIEEDNLDRSMEVGDIDSYGI